MSVRSLLDVPAPAKLNLFLHIVGQRNDGYHLLQSAFMLINWADTLHFDLRADGRITREDINSRADLPENDLVVRAACALQTATGCKLGAHIGLEKRIPMEAGMGGASSDAASCLLALNRLWDLKLPLLQLMEIGLSLGADVPFLLGGRNAWVEGIGEQLQALDLPAGQFLVVKPPSGASTPKIFQSPNLQRATKRTTIAVFIANGVDQIFEFGRNDLQPVAQTLCPDIEVGLQWMKNQGLLGRMTGSGSALFARVKEAVDTSTLPPGWIARNCNNLLDHPLIEWR